MKTTVRSFILDNMTDIHFEKLVHSLIIDSIVVYQPDDIVLEKVQDYLNELAIESSVHTFESLNEIKRMSTHYVANYENQFLPRGMSELNETTPSWKMKVYDPQEEPELEFDLDEMDSSVNVQDVKTFFTYYPQLKGERGYLFFDELQLPFRFSLPRDSELFIDKIDASNVDESNCLDYIDQDLRQVALGLANFLFEVIHYTPTNKLESDLFEEISRVKIETDSRYSFGHCVHFLLDNRTRYVSEGTQQAYSERGDGKLEVVSPGFVEFDSLYEDLSLGDIVTTHILEPFTNYLNEPLTIPELSAEALYDVLEQLIMLLTTQGFTKLEQRQHIISENKNYEKNIAYIYML